MCEEEYSKITLAAHIFTKETARPLTDFEKRVNEESVKLATNNPSLLITRKQLMDLAKDKVYESGFMFKKGKSRAKRFVGECSETKIRPKMDSEMRKSRLLEVSEDLKQVNQQILFKEKRRDQAETIRDYKLCDTLTQEIGELKLKRRSLKSEQKVLDRKSYQAAWYARRNKRSSESTSTAGASDADSESSSSLRSPSPHPKHSKTQTEVSPLLDSPLHLPSMSENRSPSSPLFRHPGAPLSPLTNNTTQGTSKEVSPPPNSPPAIMDSPNSPTINNHEPIHPPSSPLSGSQENSDFY